MIIKKLKLFNFKRFKSLEIPFDEHLNVLVGDNEAGKSTVLQAIDIVMRGSRHMVEEIGLDRLFNYGVISSFMASDSKTVDRLPVLRIEVFLNDTGNPFLNGENNSDRVAYDGIRCICEPNLDYSESIASILASDDPAFPFEYYDISFSTFRGDLYNGHNRPLRGVFIDNSMIGNDFAMSQYIQDIYKATLTDEERTLVKHQYYSSKCHFKDTVLSPFNSRLVGYALGVKESSKDNLETDLTITQEGIDISNKGTGAQCFIKTSLALRNADDRLDIVLIEEPENHLSYLNMHKMIQTIELSEGKQIFIATHSDLISTRLNLKKCSIFHSRSASFVQLGSISDETARFFMKAPDNNMLQFILADKVILVEGDAEFMLMDFFCKTVLGKTLNQAGFSVISVDGKCFKRYLELSNVLRIKTAVITDNDKCYQKSIVESYEGFVNNENPLIKVFSDQNDARYTFEVCLYQDNTDICDKVFGDGRRISVQDYMLKNKANCAFVLASIEPDGFIVPEYIQEALRWIEG